eukprot:TRINITY_DN33212_c0_g1_i1.p1 TRINITY_DN33212_c0_g1~~TRINITY_DN33212_c0_g1_i1.p1  ORF type:complete len:141 (-),score=43.58 TRINITY_DN33212_c0_g1_i1:57-479(-)
MPVDSPCLFVIVGKSENLIYQAELSNVVKRETTSPTHLSQFILHSALDVVDELIWKNTAMYLKTVDKFDGAHISAFVTCGHIKMLLLHEKKDEDGIKAFFQDVYELYLKLVLNPFYTVNSPITSTLFDERVRALGRKTFS